MANNLVIVESPAKAKTIQKFLGDDFIVESSYGHVSDLPKKGMGIDIENDFKPDYKVSDDKKEVVNRLKKKVKSVKMVWLASDEDREGEAIAWHLYNELKLTKENSRRIVFNEITKTAIQNAVENPREIDTHLVDAQQARRVLDRIVGFEVSPVLWRKVKAGLSAGRVQSVAVRLIAEKEEEIQAFEISSQYKVVAQFLTKKKETLSAILNYKFSSKEESMTFLEGQKSAEFKVAKITKKPSKRNPSAPFTTSTLQQEASSKLGYSVTRTMQVAQRLYEGGFITYMRTDSVNLSKDAIGAAVNEIKLSYGEEYVKVRQFKTKNQGAQEAHEAIRPTDFAKEQVPDGSLNSLYKMIWRRALASQMAEALLEKTSIKIEENKTAHVYEAKGETIVFDGFLRLHQDGKNAADGILPFVTEGEVVEDLEVVATEVFSKPPARYTEAALVKRLEELGIGRPSTYAPTISTIQRRQYVEMGEHEGDERQYQVLSLLKGNIEEAKLMERYGSNKRRLIPTDIGIVVNDFLLKNFKTFMEYSFTAKVESDFDKIANGKMKWTDMLHSFYGDFHKNVEHVTEHAERAKGERLLGKDPESGKNVYARIGRFGPMVQIGEVEDEEKPRFASLQRTQNIRTLTYEEAMDLFKMPRTLGEFEGLPVLVNIGRFGPYVKYDEKFISLPKGEDPVTIELALAVQLIEEKQRADAPVHQYEGKDVTKGTGRFGPFIKWNDWFINVNKKYDFDNLSNSDLEELIELKKKKEIEKVIHNWEEEGVRVEKARWGRFNVIQGKIKVELPKETKAKALTLEKCLALIEKKKPKKKATKKKTAKKKPSAKKKPAAKKKTVKK